MVAHILHFSLYEIEDLSLDDLDMWCLEAVELWRFLHTAPKGRPAR